MTKKSKDRTKFEISDRKLKASLPAEQASALWQQISDLLSPVIESAGLLGDYIRYFRQRAALATFNKMRDLATEGNLQLHPVPPKFLVQFIEKASLEDDESELVETWAELLLSAATNYDPAYVRSIEILSQIGPAEVRYLRTLFHAGRSGKDLHLIVDTPFFFASPFLMREAEFCLQYFGEQDPDTFYRTFISAIEHPGGILNFVYLVGFAEEQYECEYRHPEYVPEESPTLSTLENIGLISINRNCLLEKGDKTIMFRTVALTQYGLLFMKSCDKELRNCLRKAEQRGLITEEESVKKPNKRSSQAAI